MERKVSELLKRRIRVVKGNFVTLAVLLAGSGFTGVLAGDIVAGSTFTDMDMDTISSQPTKILAPC
jgi:hypothetical protein